jgi:membrane protein DedA with SNARE-associated domain
VLSIHSVKLSKNRFFFIGTIVFFLVCGIAFSLWGAQLMALAKAVIEWLAQTLSKFGYWGVTGLMFIESSFFFFPSELVLPPAGYLAWQGRMSFTLVLACGIAGSIGGALFNYWVAYRWGRPFFERYGRYLLVSQDSLDRADAFFQKHGHVSTFVGRLLPVIRQYISLPAGLAKMNLPVFIFYTGLGSGIWSLILTLLGYLLGEHQELLTEYLHVATLGSLFLAFCVAVIYIWRVRRGNG